METMRTSIRATIGRLIGGVAALMRAVRQHPGRSAVVGIVLLVLLGSGYAALFRAPASFTSGKVVEVPDGATLTEVVNDLGRESIVRSPTLLKGIVTLFGGQHGVEAGDYYFSAGVSLGRVAYMLVAGNHGLDPLRVTIPEGASVIDIASIVARHSNTFDEEHFVTLAREREGYLFPDTYFFLPNVSEEHVLDVMYDTFLDKIQVLADEIFAFGRPIDEVITMASILEREAHTFEDRRIIAGILWKRIALGMPLQVDATFDYINGKNSFELTLDDLEHDSPYNTYEHIGLPPGPIANPGLEAIRAAVTPIETEHLYFLSDLEGNVYYSETFEEHKEKKALYLN